LRLRLLLSASRLAICVAILGFTINGEPPAELRAAMEPSMAGPSSVDGSLFDGSQVVPQVQPPNLPAAPLPTPWVEPATSAPTWIQAPAIGLDAPVIEVGWRPTYLGNYEAMEWEVPDGAAGFHQGSAYPGQPGNTVISGHHNIGGEVFRYLVDLNVGDEVILYVDKTPYHYRVVLRNIVREYGVSDEQRRDNARWIAPTEDERLTLVTCWPYSGNSHRLIIVARPAP